MAAKRKAPTREQAITEHEGNEFPIDDVIRRVLARTHRMESILIAFRSSGIPMSDLTHDALESLRDEIQKQLDEIAVEKDEAEA